MLFILSFTPRKPKRPNVKKKKKPPQDFLYAYIPHVLIAYRRIFDKKSWETMLGCTQPFASVPACLCIGNILILSTQLVLQLLHIHCLSWQCNITGNLVGHLAILCPKTLDIESSSLLWIFSFHLENKKLTLVSKSSKLY